MSPETRAAVVAAAHRLVSRTDRAGKRLRGHVDPTILVVADPLLTEGAAVASMSFAGCLLAQLSETAVHRHATAVIIPSDGPAPPAYAVIIVEMGSRVRPPADLGFGVPIVYTGVRMDVRLTP